MTELRIAFRRLRRAPGFTAAVVIVLAFGIGGTTALFSLLDGVLLRPLPYPEADRLVRLTHEVGGVSHQQADQSDASILLYQSQAAGFEGVAGWRFDDGNLSSFDDPNTIRVRGARVTANFFDVLGVPPNIGRGFEAGEDRPGRNGVVVISHELWRDRFQMDPGAIGKQIEVNDVARTIVGIMPATFRYPSDRVRLWLPLSIEPALTRPETFNLIGIGRLSDGVSPEAARGTLESALAGPTSLYRSASLISSQTRLTPRVEELQASIVGPTSRLLFILFVSMVMVMLVACANVAGLFLIRAERMQRELAIRSALGSGLSKIVALPLAEAVVLSVIGGIAGVILSVVGVAFLKDAGSILALPRMDEVRVGGSVLMFAFGLSAFCALCVSLLPVFQTRSVTISALLKNAGAGTTPPRSGTRARGGLVVGQIALSFVLIALFGLSWRSFLQLRDVDVGFDPAGVTTSRILLPYARYGPVETRVAFFEDVTRRAESVPGVTAVGLSNWVPLEGSHRDIALEIEDSEDGLVRGANHAAAFVDSNYFSVLRIPLLRGRTFEGTDPSRPPAEVLVSQAFSERYWPDGTAIGHRIRTLGGAWFTIVGEVADVHYDALELPANDIVYFPPVVPTETGMSMAAPLSVLVRSDGSASAALSAIREIVRSIDPAVPTYDEALVSDLVRDASDRSRTLAIAFAIAAILTTILGCVGLYGVIAFSVGLRRRELAIRMALGARTAELGLLTSVDGLRLGLTGIAAGLVGTLLTAGLVDDLLYDIGSADLTTLLITSLAMLAVTSVATYLPSRRATLLSPAETLKSS